MRSILYVSHALFNRAGVEQHIRDLRSALSTSPNSTIGHNLHSSDFQIWILFRDHTKAVLLAPDDQLTVAEVEPPSWPLAPLHSPQAEAFVIKALQLSKPDLIHIHHFHNWHLSLLEQLLSHKRPTLLTFHDYFAITPHWTMQGAPSPHACFSSAYSQTIFKRDLSTQLNQRRQYLNQQFSAMQLCIAPSAFCAETIQQIYPLTIRVIEHGIAPLTNAQALLPKVMAPDTVRFTFVGSLIPQKGWELLLSSFRNLRSRTKQAHLTFLGGTPMPDEEQINFVAAYEPENLPALLRSTDIGIIPSLFCESYCLTLSELFRSGIPAIASDCGALSTRVIDGINGKKFTAGDPAALSATLNWFVEHDRWRKWQIAPPRFINAMAEEYRTLYSSFL